MKIVNSEKKLQVLEQMTRLFVSVHVISLRDYTFEAVGSSDYVDAVLSQYPNAQDAFDKVVELLVKPEYEEQMTQFLRISTVGERLGEKSSIMMDFDGTATGWSRAFFLPLTRDEEGNHTEVVFLVQHIEDEKRREEKLRILSETDGLTGLMNRLALIHRFENIINQQVTMIMMDVDKFKQFNDNFGHAVGDQVLQMVGKAIKEFFPDCSTYRYGGDEFMVIAEGEKEAELRAMMQNMQEAVASRPLGDGIPSIQMSYGILSGLPKNQKEADQLFTDVDHLLYEEKAKRR